MPPAMERGVNEGARGAGRRVPEGGEDYWTPQHGLLDRTIEDGFYGYAYWLAGSSCAWAAPGSPSYDHIRV